MACAGEINNVAIATEAKRTAKDRTVERPQSQPGDSSVRVGHFSQVRLVGPEALSLFCRDEIFIPGADSYHFDGEGQNEEERNHRSFKSSTNAIIFHVAPKSNVKPETRKDRSLKSGGMFTNRNGNILFNPHHSKRFRNTPIDYDSQR